MAELEIKPSHFGLRGFIPNYVAIQLLKQFTLTRNVDVVPAGSFAIPRGGREWMWGPSVTIRLALSLGRHKAWPPENSFPHKSSGLGCGSGPGRPGQSSLPLLVDRMPSQGRWVSCAYYDPLSVGPRTGMVHVRSPVLGL